MDREEHLRQRGRLDEIKDQIAVLETRAENTLKTLRQLAYPIDWPFLKALNVAGMDVAVQDLKKIKTEYETLARQEKELREGLGIQK